MLRRVFRVLLEETVAFLLLLSTLARFPLDAVRAGVEPVAGVARRVAGFVPCRGDVGDEAFLGLAVRAFFDLATSAARLLATVAEREPLATVAARGTDRSTVAARAFDGATRAAREEEAVSAFLDGATGALRLAGFEPWRLVEEAVVAVRELPSVAAFLPDGFST